MESFALSVPDNQSETNYVSSLKIGCIFHDIHLFIKMLLSTHKKNYEMWSQVLGIQQ